MYKLSCHRPCTLFIPATSFTASFGYGLIYLFQQGVPDTYDSFRATEYCTRFVFAILNLCHTRTNLIRFWVRVFLWNFWSAYFGHWPIIMFSSANFQITVSIIVNVALLKLLRWLHSFVVRINQHQPLHNLGWKWTITWWSHYLQI